MTHVIVETRHGIEGRTGIVSVLSMTDPSDTLKMLRETLCLAQAGLGHLYGWPGDEQVDPARERLQRLIDEIDRQRPLGPDGTHGDRHTATCGCEDRP